MVILSDLQILFGLAVKEMTSCFFGRGPTGQILVTVARWLAGKFLHFPLLAPWPTTTNFLGKFPFGKKTSAD